MNALPFPNGARFAFTILDDTDVATRANVEPLYQLLDELGMRTTKTVWPVGCPEGSANFSESQTLEDADYLAFVLDLARRGFEVTWHGATMESSTRDRTERALARFQQLFGAEPRVHANHALNRENLYWGAERIDHPVLRAAFAGITHTSRDYYRGADPSSPYWWGDLCQQHVTYMRNLTFSEINLRRVNPSMPYHDPTRPLVRWWFSATDAEDAEEFNALLTSARIERLEREGGVCILATHLGKGYVRDGVVDPGVRVRLEALARRPGWFAPVGTVLDFLRAQRSADTLPRAEWRQMQWRWARDLLNRKWVARRRARMTASMPTPYPAAAVAESSLPY